MNESPDRFTLLSSAAGARRTAVVLDLTGVSAIGPGLLGVLLRVRRRVGAEGRMPMTSMPPPA